jgi:hypothetical protein
MLDRISSPFVGEGVPGLYNTFLILKMRPKEDTLNCFSVGHVTGGPEKASKSAAEVI